MEKIQKSASKFEMDPSCLTNIVMKCLIQELEYSCFIADSNRSFSVDCFNMTINGVLKLTTPVRSRIVEIKLEQAITNQRGKICATLEFVRGCPTISCQVYIPGVKYQRYKYSIFLLGLEECGVISLKIEDIPLSVKFRIDEQSGSGTISSFKIIEWKIEEIKVVGIEVFGLNLLGEMKENITSLVSDEVQNTVRNSLDKSMNETAASSLQLPDWVQSLIK